MTKQYNFYLIGKYGRVFGRAEAHDLQNDRSAIKEANLAAAKYDIEIWEGARMVAYVVSDVTKQMPPAQKTLSINTGKTARLDCLDALRLQFLPNFGRLS